MSIWQTYPPDYREKEVQRILAAVKAGECVSVIGLSGAGKSNLMGYLANRPEIFTHSNALVDCNRLRGASSENLFRLIRQSLGDRTKVEDEFEALDPLIAQHFSDNGGGLALLLDRFEILADSLATGANLRALRDMHKYQLTFVPATRRPIDPASELAELFYGHTLWLGPLSESDTSWNVQRYARRIGQSWPENIAAEMRALTRGYPSLLRAVCEAYGNGALLDLHTLQNHPAIQRRVNEFWADAPNEEALENTGLAGLPLLKQVADPEPFDTAQLTEKEFRLLDHLRAHADEVCRKDDLIQAVWPEDQVFTQGIRDDSLAQLVRRLRVKIEPDPSAPQYIQTVPGRGYKFCSNKV